MAETQETLIESHSHPQAIHEVSSLRVWDLHLFPFVVTLRFAGLDGGAGEVWTTDRLRAAELPGALTPKQYTAGSGKDETIGERAARCRLRLHAIEVAERKG